MITSQLLTFAAQRILKGIANNLSELNNTVNYFCLPNLGWEQTTSTDASARHNGEVVRQQAN